MILMKINAVNNRLNIKYHDSYQEVKRATRLKPHYQCSLSAICCFMPDGHCAAFGLSNSGFWSLVPVPLMDHLHIQKGKHRTADRYSPA